MDKEHISRDAFFAIYDFLDNDNGPRCLIDELDGFRYYFCSSSWIERATLDVFSNGVYLGEVDSNHRRHGIGVYVFNNGGIYLENGLRVREMVGAFIIPADKYSGVNGVPEKRTEEDIFGK